MRSQHNTKTIAHTHILQESFSSLTTHASSRAMHHITLTEAMGSAEEVQPIKGFCHLSAFFHVICQW